MKKTIAIILIALFGTVSISSVALAKKGNKRKGKFTYRNVYKECHKIDPSVSITPPINPDTKTMAQWDRVFENKNFDQFGCKDVWGKLSEGDLVNIHTYLRSGAADSPTPARCN